MSILKVVSDLLRTIEQGVNHACFVTARPYPSGDGLALDVTFKHSQTGMIHCVQEGFSSCNMDAMHAAVEIDRIHNFIAAVNDEVRKAYSYDHNPQGDEWERAGWVREAPTPECGCHRCTTAKHDQDGGNGWPIATRLMILCPVCGNKRCPHATDHNLPCSGSNEPGQKGSLYE